MEVATTMVAITAMGNVTEVKDWTIDMKSHNHISLQLYFNGETNHLLQLLLVNKLFT